MDYEDLLFFTDNNIATIRLNKPEVRNRLSNRTRREILEALEKAKNDVEVRVVIITGTGDVFCAGADIKELKSLSTVDDREIYGSYAELCKAFKRLGKPSIAAVNGLALAGGLGLAIYPDITVASDNAVFGTPEINVGVWPMMVSATLQRVVGRKRALELMLTGRTFDAREAERIGLVNRVVPRNELDKVVIELAGELKSKSPVITRFGLDTYYAIEDLEFDHAVEYLRDMLVLLLTTEDAQEGVSAFLEKRIPVWKGR